MNSFFLIFFFLLGSFFVRADEPLPPAPQHYFTDTAGVVSPADARTLNTELAQFEQATSNQIVVAIYPQFPSKSSIDDYAQRLYSAWHPGTKKNSNGVLLLVFIKEHQIRIQTGYGLEGALPDALCKRIIDDVMVPAFKQGDYNGGMTAGIAAIMKATAKEYQGLPKKKNSPSWKKILFSPLGFFLLMMLGSIFMSWRRQRMGLDAGGSGGWFIGGGGFGGGDGGGFGGGGFSGGGGDSGGGGAGGGW